MFNKILTRLRKVTAPTDSVARLTLHQELFRIVFCSEVIILGFREKDSTAKTILYHLIVFDFCVDTTLVGSLGPTP